MLREDLARPQDELGAVGQDLADDAVAVEPGAAAVELDAVVEGDTVARLVGLFYDSQQVPERLFLRLLRERHLQLHGRLSDVFQHDLHRPERTRWAASSDKR